MKNKILFLLAMVLVSGCTQQQRAKEWGGTANVVLPSNQKLICVSWEQTHLWYLYRPMRTNEVPENYVMKEQSSWGVFQGEVNFIESH